MSRIEISFEQFSLLSENCSVVPVCGEIITDLLTPVSAFMKVAEDAENAFLLESVEGGEHVARYSFLGKDPFMILKASKGATVIERDGVEERVAKPFMETLRSVVGEFRSAVVPGLPRFTGGAVGFLGYEASQWFEPSLQESWQKYDVLGDSDDAGFMVFDTVLVFDHVKRRLLIIANASVDSDKDLRQQYNLALAKIQFLEDELSRSLSARPKKRSAGISFESNTTQAKFERNVEKAQGYIRAGDIYQVVLSQRFEAQVSVDPFTVYRTLRYVNPSPYMYFIRMGSTSLIGSSPEMLVRVEGDKAETHPIAGTRPRGANEDDDARLAEDLLADEKELSEHVMLVDLGRNDLGRVCEYGTVTVPTFMEIEKYSHVMHLVSRVEGHLATNRDRLDALGACFPAGTVSGAPKIRAMEIIAELEGCPRGPYAGALGYLDFGGQLDCCITIRTIVMKNGRAYVQAGAGIVADSNPSSEYKETKDKAFALMKALQMAEKGEGPNQFGAT